MNVLKQLGILLVFIVVVTAVLSLVLPTHQKIERTVTIAAPAADVYENLAMLEHFNKITVWNQRDSLARHTLEGTDGTVGATYSWDGDPTISGRGKMKINSLEPGKMIEHTIDFSYPKKGHANSTLTLNETNGSTTVTWAFRKATPRPWNIFNLFYSLDKEMGSDFEEGLAKLKKTFEHTGIDNPGKPSIEIKPFNFPATTYAIIRQQVKWEDIPEFYKIHTQRLFNYITDTTTAKQSSLIYNWDEKLRQADIAAAVEVPAGTKIEDPIISVIDIPASKAVSADYTVGMKNKSELYLQLRKYLSDNKLKQAGPIIEQVLSPSSKQPGWSIGNIRVIFLVE